MESSLQIACKSILDLAEMLLDGCNPHQYKDNTCMTVCCCQGMSGIRGCVFDPNAISICNLNTKIVQTHISS